MEAIEAKTDMSAQAVNHRGSRLAEIDALRGIAAVLVLLFHYTTRFDQIYGHSRPLEISFPWAYVGVNLFFIISGFVIFMTLERTRHAGEFVVSRFSRLYPAYWVAVVITFLVVRSIGLPGKQVSSNDAALNLLMFHGSFGVPHVDAVYWTLEVELLFYAIAFSIFLLRRLHQVHYFLYGLIGLKVAYAIVSRQFGIDLPWRIQWALILPFIPWFACGIAIYRTSAGRSTRRHDYGILAAAVLAIGYVDGIEFGLLCLFFSALVWLAAHHHLRLLRNRLILWLGFISYPLYLLHENIGWGVIRIIEHAGFSPWLAIGAASGLALLLASLVASTMERPAMQWIRSQFKHGRSHREGWQRLGRSLPLVALVLIAPLYGLASRAAPERSPTIVQPQSAHAIDCHTLLQEKPVVLLVLGQSNAANHGAMPPVAASAAVIHNGRCYRSTDPLPGGTGSGASIWTQLPAAWQALGQTRPLAFSIVAVESTTIRQWTGQGELLERAADQLTGLRRVGMAPDAVLWLQGEADARDGTSEADYLAGLQRLSNRLSDAGLDASTPIMVATATRCQASESAAIRRAQMAAPALKQRFIAGPDLDQLADDLRVDRCHFSAAGLQKAASLWANTLANDASLRTRLQSNRTTSP
jgi:peptidoglycan/LPS O-acetylase OafA/YrhL